MSRKTKGKLSGTDFLFRERGGNIGLRSWSNFRLEYVVKGGLTYLTVLGGVSMTLAYFGVLARETRSSSYHDS